MKRARDEYPESFENESRAKKYKVNDILVEPLNDDLNSIVLEYVIDYPCLEFTMICMEGNIEIAIWLQDNFRYDQWVDIQSLQLYFDDGICISKCRPLIWWYMETFGISYYPYRCVKTAIDCNIECYYKEYIQDIIEIEKGSQKQDYSYLLNIILIAENTNALKHIVEDKKIEFQEDMIDEISRISSIEFLDYLYKLCKDQRHISDIMYRYWIYICKLCSKNDIKEIMSFCEHRLNILSRLNADEENMIIELIRGSWLSTVHMEFAGNYKWIRPDILIYIIKVLPPSINQIKQSANDIIRYLRITKSKELLTLFENIIGCNLLFLSNDD